jgi:hypothetical protein
VNKFITFAKVFFLRPFVSVEIAEPATRKEEEKDETCVEEFHGSVLQTEFGLFDLGEKVLREVVVFLQAFHEGRFSFLGQEGAAEAAELDFVGVIRQVIRPR